MAHGLARPWLGELVTRFGIRNEFNRRFQRICFFALLKRNAEGWWFCRISKYILSRRRLEGHSLRVRHKQDRTEAKSLNFYNPRLLYCPNQMLEVIVLSQHRVSSFRIVRPRAPCGARFIRHVLGSGRGLLVYEARLWLVATHLQFGEGARPHLCKDEWNRP